MHMKRSVSRQMSPRFRDDLLNPGTAAAGARGTGDEVACRLSDIVDGRVLVDVARGRVFHAVDARNGSLLLIEPQHSGPIIRRHSAERRENLTGEVRPARDAKPRDIFGTPSGRIFGLRTRFQPTARLWNVDESVSPVYGNQAVRALGAGGGSRSTTEADLCVASSSM